MNQKYKVLKANTEFPDLTNPVTMPEEVAAPLVTNGTLRLWVASDEVSNPNPNPAPSQNPNPPQPSNLYKRGE